ncbi:MAG: acyl-CoA dehydrogenase [Deltaproteobacteria bacterium RIFOXYC2_FULL_48_10]|nr:MAG: acyl-CoA dehydrogenase [Deltaproteobacteria bacterium RIFOXYC2_FULL_48_10]
MAQVLADRREMEFVLHEQFEVSRLSEHQEFSEFNRKTIDMIMAEVRTLAIKEILPTLKIGDQTGCRYENGKVTVPPEFKRAWNQLIRGGWFAPCQNPEWGGQGMPHALHVMAQNYLIGANMSLLMVAGLNQGAGRIIEQFGSDTQKKCYLENIYAGRWSGTMALTESECGSNLGDLSTSAVKNADGTYSLTGNKIFISGGDQDMTENIIHLVLARIVGAPEGSRGISLFVVPKFHVNADGSLGERNDMVCTGIEEKMGLHGSPTCSMALGGKGKCIGTLVGEENKGLPMMFLMMNEARLMVGAQALSCASSAYLYALDYARQRVQGPPLSGKDRSSVAIINHPDVRRMLLTMKSYTEGMRSLLCYIAHLEDQKKVSEDSREKERYQNLIEILTPVGKGYVTDRAVEVCNLAVQVFGGYGYTSEFPVEQLLRDVRITTIYEGTNGIQAMDLLGRKLQMKNMGLFFDLVNEIKTTLAEVQMVDSLSALSGRVETAVNMLCQVAEKMDESVRGEAVLRAYAYANPFLEATGDVIMAWMLLWRAAIAEKKLEKGVEGKEADFYEGQLNSAEFFISGFLPVTMGKMASIMDLCSAAINISDTSFGGR